MRSASRATRFAPPSGSARQAAAHLARPRQRAPASRSTPGIGLDAELVRRVDDLGRREDGKRPGDLAFALAIARALGERRFRYPESLEVEGLGRAAFALVANCSPYTYAGRVGLRFAPATFEGGLDVVAPIDVRAARIPRLAVQAVRGRPRAGFVLLGHDLDRIVIRCDMPLPAQVDGEDIGDIEEAEIVAERDAVTVLVGVGGGSSTLPPWRTRSRSPTWARG